MVIEFLKWMVIFLFAYYVISAFASLFFLFVQFFRIHNLRHQNFNHYDLEEDSCIPVSIVLSISEQEETLLKVIDNLKELDYPEYEIVMVYDGKNQMFLEHVLNTFGLEQMNHPYRRKLQTLPNIAVYEGKIERISFTLIHKEEGTLGDNYNAAFNLAKYPYLLLTREDILVSSSALKKMMYMMLSHHQMVACGGLTSFSVPSSKLLFFLQKSDYQRRKLLGYSKKPRRFTSLNSLWMVKKDMVFEVGGFQEELHEDVNQFMVSLYDYCWEKEMDMSVLLVPEDVSSIMPCLSWSEYASQENSFVGKMVWEFLAIVLLLFAAFFHVYDFYSLLAFYVLHLIFSCFFLFFISFISKYFLEKID